MPGLDASARTLRVHYKLAVVATAADSRRATVPAATASAATVSAATVSAGLLGLALPCRAMVTLPTFLVSLVVHGVAPSAQHTASVATDDDGPVPPLAPSKARVAPPTEG